MASDRVGTFPALVGLVHREVLNVPIVGVAKSGWNLDRFRDYAARSVRDNGMDVDSAATPACRSPGSRSTAYAAGLAVGHWSDLEVLTIAGHPEISVVGDIMSRDRLPGVAEVAMQSGLYAGRRIKHRIEGKKIRRFRYHDLGSAAYLSRGNAVVSAGPLRFAGFPGWLAWLLIHIAFLTGFRNRVGAVLTWAAAFARDARRERAFTTQQIERLRDVYDPPSGRKQPTNYDRADRGE